MTSSAPVTNDASLETGLFFPGRDAGELRHDELKIAVDCGEIRKYLIGQSQCERVFL